MSDPKPVKKQYESPDLVTESVLETSTLACGKCSGGGPTGSSTPACKSVRKLS